MLYSSHFEPVFSECLVCKTVLSACVCVQFVKEVVHVVDSQDTVMPPELRTDSRAREDHQVWCEKTWKHVIPTLEYWALTLRQLKVAYFASCINCYCTCSIHCGLFAFSALTLSVWAQEEHPAHKNRVMRCRHGYLSRARCRYNRSLSHLLHQRLHCLDVPQPVQIKLCATIPKCLQSRAPQYLMECCIPLSSITYLQSAGCHQLFVPCHWHSMFCLQAFSLLCGSPDDLKLATQHCS